MRAVLAASTLVTYGAASRAFFVPSQVAPAPHVTYSVLPEAPAPAQPVAYPIQLQPVGQGTREWSPLAFLAVAAISGAAGALAALGAQGRRAPSVVMEEGKMSSALAQADLVRVDEVSNNGIWCELVNRGNNEETLEDLKGLAVGLNPAVGYWDPLELGRREFWDQSNEATIGFLRHAEIKHGRVAMAGFVGYIVHANGIHFPWKIPGDELCAKGVSPPALWENIPNEAKWQIILAIGIFEFYSEAATARSPGQGGHYMRGGKPGYFPPFTLKPSLFTKMPGDKGKSGLGLLEDAEGTTFVPHPVPLNLYDPFGFNMKKSDQWKADKLKVEVNNGRLAMIGLMSLLSEGAVPGSVPALKGLIPASGEINVMSPFDFSAPLFGTVATLSVGGSEIVPRVETQADLETLAKGLNPVVGFWDPLNLAEGEFWDQSNEATIGFLRHAEIKHGRVAMAGFVGYCVHANGIHFPWKVPGDELCAPGVSPPELWQNIPAEAKWQILLTIGLFEFYSESAMAKSPGQGGHYMRGGKPGFFPPFNLPKGVKGQSGIGTLEDSEGGPLLPHPVPLNLYDPFGFNKNKSDEWKAKKLQTEINNGRLAMIGLMSLLSEGAVPGSVPALKGLIPATGEINVMSPFDFTKPFFG